METNPIFSLPLSDVMRPDIALPLQHMLGLYSVGRLLGAWRNPKNHRNIERLFDHPAQAHEAIAVIAAWFGFESTPAASCQGRWWLAELPTPSAELPSPQAAQHTATQDGQPERQPAMHKTTHQASLRVAQLAPRHAAHSAAEYAAFLQYASPEVWKIAGALAQGGWESEIEVSPLAKGAVCRTSTRAHRTSKTARRCLRKRGKAPG